MICIGVAGPSAATSHEENAAAEVGKLIAEAGATLVCGGLGGVMAAACRGAAEAGGMTVGLLPGTDRADANPWVRIAIPTGMGEGRNALIVRASDGLVAIGGEFGTLSEIAFALKLGKPVAGIGTWRLERETPTMDPILRASNAPEAIRLILERLG